jgi:hypothetical protein
VDGIRNTGRQRDKWMKEIKDETAELGVEEIQRINTEE